MAWITARGYRYYCRHEREGKRVRRVHLGRGPLAELAAVLDESRRKESQEQKQAWNAQEARRAAADQALDALTSCVRQLAEERLIAAGFHQHAQGEWRRSRGAQARPSGL